MDKISLKMFYQQEKFRTNKEFDYNTQQPFNCAQFVTNTGEHVLVETGVFGESDMLPIITVLAVSQKISDIEEFLTNNSCYTQPLPLVAAI